MRQNFLTSWETVSFSRIYLAYNTDNEDSGCIKCDKISWLAEKLLASQEDAASWIYVNRDVHLLQMVWRKKGWQDAVVVLRLAVGTVVRAPVGSWRFVGCRRRHKRCEGTGRSSEEIVQAGRAVGRGPPSGTWRWGWDWLDHEEAGLRSVGHCKNGRNDELSGVWGC